MIKAAEELDGFQKILEAEGVTVRRPTIERGDFSTPFRTPDFEEKCGLYAAMPRDILLTVFGNDHRGAHGMEVSIFLSIDRI